MLGSVLLVLAVVVTLLVYWQLRYTGITMTNVTYCGCEEHVHTEECYEYTLICGFEVSEGHTHADECYESVEVLTCGLEESDEHTHDEFCYETQLALICGLKEFDGHTHTDECYEKTLICGLEEHTHTVECLIDLTADVEDESVWTLTLPTLSGNLRADVVNVACSQLGYTESTANYSVGEDGVTHYGYTRYGAWYGNEYGSWNAMFAAFCLHYSGVDETEFPVNSGAYSWAVQLSELDLYASASEYSPELGDLIFFDTDLDERILTESALSMLWMNPPSLSSRVTIP